MYSVIYPDMLARDNFAVEKPIAKNKCNLTAFQAKQMEDVADDIWHNADALVTGLTLKINTPLINKLHKCKIITRLGVGFDLIDIETCGKSGIAVCNVPDYGTYEVADHAIALILNFARGISYYNQILKKDLISNWDFSKAPNIDRLTNKTLGIIGLGRIGTACALRAKALGLKVKFFDPYVPDGQEKALNIERFDCVEDLAQSSDYISIHCLANNETNKLVNADLIKLFKSNVIIVNTARGVIIDIDAVYDGLKLNQIKAVGLDVLPNEPPNKDHPLIKAWRNEEWAEGRIIITPHSAFYSPEGLVFLREKSLKTCLDHIEGIRTVNCVNTEYLIKPR